MELTHFAAAHPFLTTYLVGILLTFIFLPRISRWAGVCSPVPGFWGRLLISVFWGVIVPVLAFIATDNEPCDNCDCGAYCSRRTEEDDNYADERFDP